MKKLLLGVAVSVMLLTGAAHAQQQFYKQDAGQWTVEGFRGDMNYCAASTFWDNGSYITFFVTDKDVANILIHNKDWNIGDPVGYFKGYTATLRFFGKYPSEQGTIEYELKDAQTVLLPNVNIEFLKDWSRFDVMNVIMPGDISQMEVGLGGTNSAVSLLGECLNQLSAKSGQNL
jgi:hypothetical protein